MTARPWRKSIPEGAETLCLLTEECQRANRGKVDKHESELIDGETGHIYGLRKEPSGGPARNHMIRSDVEKLMDDTVKTAVEVATRHVIRKIVEETIKDVLKAG